MPVIGDIFAHARVTPDKTAVIYNGHAVSYRGFASSVVLARRFFDGVGVDRTRVAILFANVFIDAWIFGLALRSLGVTTVQARDIQDIERLALGAPTLVASDGETWPGLESAAAQAGAPLVTVPAHIYLAHETVSLEAPLPPGPRGGHILLTSGTTGHYKKVLVNDAVEAWNLRQRRDLYGLTPDSVVNVFGLAGWTSVGHHLPVATWSVGGAAVIDQRAQPRLSLAAPGLSLVYTHPQLLAALVASRPDAIARNDAMTVIVTSGALAPALWRAARARLSLDVRTCIGSTEAGVISMTRVEDEEDLVWHRIAPTCEVQVVDDDGRPTPAGQSGLLRIRTTGVDGYLDDPEATGAFFRDGFFYPGDMGVLREDGRLALRGRVTEVINVMGHKLALGLETILTDRLGAVAVCVFSTADTGGEDEVHVVVQRGRAVSAADLKAALQAALPGLATVRVHAIEAMPRGDTGKIERAGLKARILGAPD